MIHSKCAYEIGDDFGGLEILNGENGVYIILAFSKTQGAFIVIFTS